MTRLSKLLTVAAAVLGVGTAHATVIDFSFDSLDPNLNGGNIAATPLTLTDPTSGLTATFSSPDDPGAFVVLNIEPSLSFSEDVLVSPLGTGSELDITFSESLTSFTADFGTAGPGPLDLTGLLGGLSGTTVGSSSATGVVDVADGGSFPQGTISFSGATFDSLILSDDTDPTFALGNFSVTTATVTSVPEPSSLALLALGLACLGLVRRTRRN